MANNPTAAANLFASLGSADDASLELTTFQKCHAGRHRHAQSMTQIPEIKTHRPGRQDRADCLQRQAWDIRSPGKLSPGACQARTESHLCPLIGVTTRELFAPILPAAYLNSKDTQVATSGALGRCCCCRDLRRRCALENIAFSPTVGSTSKDGAQDQDEEAGGPNAPAEAWLLLWWTVSWTTPPPPPPPLRQHGSRQLLMLGRQTRCHGHQLRSPDPPLPLRFRLQRHLWLPRAVASPTQVPRPRNPEPGGWLA